MVDSRQRSKEPDSNECLAISSLAYIELGANKSVSPDGVAKISFDPTEAFRDDTISLDPPAAGACILSAAGKSDGDSGSKENAEGNRRREKEGLNE